MKLQLSSGYGPAECELAVGKLLRALQKEYPDIQIDQTVRGAKSDCYQSVQISSKQDFSHLEGSVKWICESPYRRGHKRKNWFVDISICKEDDKPQALDENLVRFETFRSGGKGGQHVNKVETGVRAIHIPSGMAAASTSARSQHMNKKLALNRLCDMLTEQERQGASNVKEYNRLEHSRIVRGNAVRTYEGMEFRLINSNETTETI